MLHGEAGMGPGGLGGWSARRFQDQLREDSDIQSVMLGVPPKPHPTGKEGRKGGREGSRQEGRKAGRKEGQTKPGSLCDSSGRKVSMRTSPKHPMKSKASKTKITFRNKTEVLLFLLSVPLQWGQERIVFSLPCCGAGTEHESMFAFSTEQTLAQQ